MHKLNMKNKPKTVSTLIRECLRCPLHKTRKKAVPGQGNPHAEIMFIGEAPGANEDLKGIPFCGKAGAVLDELLNSVGLKRNEIYITNILKCRPPGNRNPNNTEIESCVPYLERQIELINPEIICCLGNFAVRFIMEKFGLADEIKGISKIHGKQFSCSSLSAERLIIPLYHPAVATYNANMKPVLVEDFNLLKNLVRK